MKNTVFLSFSLLLSVLVFGQERKLIKGQLLYKNTKVVAANVVNNTAQINTITNSDGEFEIEVTEGDELIFSSVQYQIRTVKITSEILKNNRLVVTVNENINELKEVVVTTEDVEKFLDLKEEEFKGFDYEVDKSSRLDNQALREKVLSNGLNFVNIAKLVANAFANKTQEEQMRLKPSEILPFVFESTFFENDLGIPPEKYYNFLEYCNPLGIEDLYRQNRKMEMILILKRESITYLEITENSIE